MKIQRIEALQLRWDPKDPPAAGSAFLRVWSDDGRCGLGEASPMQGGLVSLAILKRHIAPAVIGADPLDHAVIHDKLLHRLVKLGPEGALTSALAALDIALWDLKGSYWSSRSGELLGGAWRTALPFYSSIGGNGATRSLDEVLRIVEARLRDKPAAIKIRFDNDRIDARQRDRRITSPRRARCASSSATISRSLSTPTTATRRAAPCAWGASSRSWDTGGSRNRCSTTTCARRARSQRKLSITVSAGEQSYTPAAVADLILAGVPMVQPDIVKMGGITGMQRCAALAQAHGAEFVPHQTQPTIGHMANLHVAATQLHATKPCELNDPSPRMHAVFVDPPVPMDGLFHLPNAPGLGLTIDETELAHRTAQPPSG